MSSGAPAWLVLVTAALAVVGTLAAAIITQVLSGRRETRQWERQKAQDEARWDRERIERREQWEREDHARWHQERLAAYSELLQGIEDWDMAISQALPRIPAVVSEEGQRRVSEALAEIARADTRARFFATEETSKAAGAFYIGAFSCWLRVEGGGLDDPEHLRDLRFELRRLHDFKNKLRTLLRRDLGISAEKPSDLPAWMMEVSDRSTHGAGASHRRKSHRGGMIDSSPPGHAGPGSQGRPTPP
ncbi:hypothetical protein ACFT9M_25485 [Micromonospora purpureochromogenes]|uniref:hypothetical protein n=1 Tax=Micromonospora purpureochromogenes TaxID=47872 RepID=UPI0036436EC7